MINVIEKQNLIWESGEQKKYRISYQDHNGTDRTYHCDFVINDQLIEIKPKNLRNSKIVLIKEKSAIEWCLKHNFEYKLILDTEFERLSREKIKKLHDNGTLKFTNRYEEKYNCFVQK